MGVAVALVAIWAGRANRVLAVIIAAVWFITCVMGYEFASQFEAFGIMSYAGYAFDPTFFFGSVVRIRHPWPTYILLGVVIVSAMVLFRHRPRTAGPGWILPASLVALIGLAFIPIDFEFAEWRQDNVIIANLASLIPLNAPAEKAQSPETIARLKSSFSPDLSGRLAQPTEPGSNVLLVLLESVSGAYLPSLAEEQGVISDVKMPMLDARANSFVSFKNFVDLQRQTNRGEYAILCGDYPKLASYTARMNEFAFAATRRCLPQILQDAGYRTAYMQPAPLAFMTKDAFMQNIGFADIFGYQSLPRAYSRTSWGVDDRAFFEQSVDKIRALHLSGKPWFATLLTSGTHHPFNVPDDFNPPGLDTHRQKAFAWLDQGLEAFLKELENEGILDNTLVIITSDESAGILFGNSARVRAISQNWGFAILQSPTMAKRQVGEIFSQSDIGLSILDYLGLADLAPHFVGRSMFRDYDKERSVYFSNTYLRRAGLLTTSGITLNCSESGRVCRAWQNWDQHPFGPNAKSTEVPGPLQEELAGAIAVSLEGSLQVQGDQLQSMQLIQPGDYSVPPKNRVSLFAGQFLTIPKDTLMEVDLSFEVLPGTAMARIGHDVVSSLGKIATFPTEEMQGGDKRTIHYTFAFADSYPRVELRLPVQNQSDTPIRIRFNRASMTLKSTQAERDQLSVIKDELEQAAER